MPKLKAGVLFIQDTFFHNPQQFEYKHLDYTVAALELCSIGTINWLKAV